jgi:hypothetical protein
MARSTEIIWVLVAGAALACADRPETPRARRGGYVTEYTHLSDSVVHLPTGDSIEFQATGPAEVPNSPPGLMITYHPFFPIADTARVKSAALALFRAVRERAGGAPPPPFVVLRAVGRRAAERRGPYYEQQVFGVVLERRADGRWYVLGERLPVPD